MVFDLNTNGWPSDVVAASVVVYACLWCIYRQSNYSMGWGFDSVFADGPYILGRGSRQWMVKPLSCHPFAAYWGCVSVLTIAIIFLGFFRDHSYEIVTAESGYPMMQCEYYCALCNGLPTLLHWFASFDLDVINCSRDRYQMIWCCGWVCHIWVVNSGNDDIIFHDIQSTPSLVMNWRFTGWWMFLLIRTALLLAH